MDLRSVGAGNELMAFEKTKMHNGFFSLLFLENYESTRYFGPRVHDMLHLYHYRVFIFKESTEIFLITICF